MFTQSYAYIFNQISKNHKKILSTKNTKAIRLLSVANQIITGDKVYQYKQTTWKGYRFF